MKDEKEDFDGLHYQNGQSDVEKLMRLHLQTPGHVITDEELRNLKVGITEEPSAGERKRADGTKDPAGFSEKQEGDAQSSPWEVLGE
jgi:hypothetical protein